MVPLQFHWPLEPPWTLRSMTQTGITSLCPGSRPTPPPRAPSLDTLLIGDRVSDAGVSENSRDQLTRLIAADFQRGQRHAGHLIIHTHMKLFRGGKGFLAFSNSE